MIVFDFVLAAIHPTVVLFGEEPVKTFLAP